MMFSKSRFFTLVLFLLLSGLATGFMSTGNAAGSNSVTSWLPGDVLVTVELRQADDLLALVENEELIAFIKGIPNVGEGLADENLVQVKQVVLFLETQLETTWQDGLQTLLSGGVTLVVLSDGSLVVIVESSDAVLLKEFHETLRGLAGLGPQSIESEEYRGIDVWTIDGNAPQAIIDNRLVLSNTPQGLRRIVDLALGSETTGTLQELSSYAEAQNVLVAENQDLTAFVRMDVLTNIPDIQTMLDQADNPWASLILGGIPQAVADASWVAASLDLEGTDITLEIVTDGLLDSDSPLAAFTRSPKTGRPEAMPNFETEDMIAAVSFYRDLHQFYAAKDDLFPERTSELIFFENMMGIFFSGRDLTDDVFAELEPEVRLVVAKQSYEGIVGRPSNEFPGFALIFRLKDPDNFSIVMEEAWQKAIGLVNFTSGQDAQPGLIIDRPVQGETTFTVARYAPVYGAEPSEELHVRHNFSPVIAMPGDYVILASCEEIARKLIDAAESEIANGTTAYPDYHTLLQVDGALLADAFEANREGMIDKNMIEKGMDREEAEKEFEGLMFVARLIGDVQIGASESDETLRLKLTVEPSIP
jgi:hypothetical protein